MKYFILILGLLPFYGFGNCPSPQKEEILDICVDMVCIGYSLGEVLCTGGGTGWTALAADCASALTPGMTGGGAAVRTARNGQKLLKGRSALKFSYFAKAGIKQGKWRIPFEVIQNSTEHVFKRHGANTTARSVSKFYGADAEAVKITIKSALKRRVINPNSCKTFLREEGFDFVIDMGKYIGTDKYGKKASLMVMHFNPTASGHKFTAYPANYDDLLSIFRISK